MTNITHISCRAMVAIIVTGAKGPGGVVQHLLSHAGRNYHLPGLQGSRPLARQGPGCLHSLWPHIIRGPGDYLRCAGLWECTGLTRQFFHYWFTKWMDPKQSEQREKAHGVKPRETGGKLPRIHTGVTQPKLGLQQRVLTAHVIPTTRKLIKSRCQGVLPDY